MKDYTEEKKKDYVKGRAAELKELTYRKMVKEVAIYMAELQEIVMEQVDADFENNYFDIVVPVMKYLDKYGAGKYVTEILERELEDMKELED
jgi:hypothetical protein